MSTTANSLPSSAADSSHAPASRPLELLEARQLRDSLEVLLRREQSAMADFLVALADFDRQRGWEALGYASLFAFLNVELGLSKGASYTRFAAARLLQAFPDVILPIRQGRLCLSAVGELARVATAENLSQVLPRFFGCSSREAREIAAAVLPREMPPVRDQVTSLAPPVERRGETARPPDRLLDLAPNPARDDVEPLTADLRRLHVTVSRQLLQKLEVARDGLSHSLPGATTERHRGGARPPAGEAGPVAWTGEAAAGRPAGLALDAALGCVPV